MYTFINIVNEADKERIVSMKKFTSFLLMLSMLISIIYLPGLTIRTAAANILPDGTELKRGVWDTYPNATPIGTAAEFRDKVVAGGTYRLTADIDLNADGVNYVTKYLDTDISNESSATHYIRIDGGGYTIRTPRMLFGSLANGSYITNLRITGTISKYASEVESYPANSLASLCGKAGGGVYKDIINEATVTANAVNTNDNRNVRVSGLIGSCFYNSILIQNCENKAQIMGRVDSGTSHYYAVAGILAYSGINDTSGAKLSFIAGCKNSGVIKNTSSGSNWDLAGGILGVKQTDTYCQMIGCVNTGNISCNNVASSGSGADPGTEYAGAGYDGCSSKTYISGMTYDKDAIPVRNAEEFAQIKGDNHYYIAETINYLTQKNKEPFTGTIYGLTRSVGATEPPFADMDEATFKNFVIKVSGWTKITTPQEFLAIVNNGSSVDYSGAANVNNRYYLGANIDLAGTYPNWKGPSNFNAWNSAQTIILDGCGFTVTTSKPIFPELPGGGEGNDGTHSTIRNLKIAGNVSVNNVDLANKGEASYDSSKSYDNGHSAGALVGKANGGIFENITNNANITLTSSMSARVGGIIGSVFNDNITMVDCVNNGKVVAPINGNLNGAGGIIGLIGYNDNGTAKGVYGTFVNCVNNGAVNNNSSATTHVYAGGIIGVKYHSSTTAYLIDCSNKGKIFAKTAYGKYYADRLQQNVHVIKSIPISTAEEFMNISGKKAYSLTADIVIEERNNNFFNGYLIGNGHSVTTPDRLFLDETSPTVFDVNVKINALAISGHALEDFAVVAATANDPSAVAVVNHVNTKYGIKLPIKVPSDQYKGDAILINQGNTYGNYRHGLDYGLTEDGYVHVYLDETSANIQSYVNTFLSSKLTTSKTAYDFADGFGGNRFTYDFAADQTNGLTLSKTKSQNLARGVKYMENTYKRSDGVEVLANIIILERDAQAHFEMYASPLTKVTCTNKDSSGNSYADRCGNMHVLAANKKTVTELATELKSKGKTVLAATNASYFMLSSGCNTPWGMQIVNGTVNRAPRKISGSALGNRWFGVTKDGTPLCGDSTSYTSGQIYNGVGGKYYLIKNGKYVEASDKDLYKTPDARTAVGYTVDGDIVIVTVAGNNNDAEHPGATLTDLSQIFMELDMDIYNALNLDGGGSSAMVTKDGSGGFILQTPQYSNTTTTTQRDIVDIMAIVLD